MVQAGHSLFPDLEVSFPEDHLITGLLRHSLRDVSITSYETGVTRHLWLYLLSHCPTLGGFKRTFFNQVVLDKTSSRGTKRIRYCGSPFDMEVWTFFLCLHYELVLGQADHLLGGIIPNIAWTLCRR